MWSKRIWNVLRPGRLEREMQEELDFHRELRRRSLSTRFHGEELERATSRRMGSMALTKEEIRDARLNAWLTSALQDLRFGLTLMRRDAGMSALIVLVLALGIGGNAAIFTLLKTAFLDPLPYSDSAKLVVLYDRFSRLGVNRTSPTIPEFVDVRDRNRSFEHMAFLDHRDYQLTGADEPVRVFAARVTASFFPLLGVSAAMGRTFLNEENTPGHNHAVIVSNAFWRNRLGADPNVIGRVLHLNGDPCPIVGVMPPGFSFDYPTLGVPEPAEIYVPFDMSDAYMLRTSPYGNVRRVLVLARLGPGVSSANASADTAAIAAQLSREHPELYSGPKGESSGFSVNILPLREAIVGRQRPLLWLLSAGVGVLLLIACANTAQLLLARSLRRSREIAIRTALGASRIRLVRQFLMEGLVLAAFGGVTGLVTAGWLARLLVTLLPVANPLFAEARADWRVAAFAAATSLISAIAFAILPAVKGSTWTPGPSLSSRAAVGQGNRWRHAMISIEAALSVFLLCGAALVALNLRHLVTTPSGFDAQRVVVMQLRMPYRREQALRPTPMMGYREYLERVSAVPGVDSAALVTGLPLRGAGQTGFRLEGAPDDAANSARHRALSQAISPDYFRTLRIPIVSGRAFRDDDRTGRPAVVIVNQEFVRRFANGRDLLGRRIDLDRPASIIGVVGDVRMSASATAPEPQIYTSYLQYYEPNEYLLVRSALSQNELMPRVKAAIRSAYPDQAVFNVITMEDVFARSIAEPRFQAWLTGAFAFLALAIATTGMYSVVACLVSQRTSEIAIRVALGAGRLAIIRTVLGATTIWVTVGLAVGIVLGIAAGGTVQRLTGASVAPKPGMYMAAAGLFLLLTLAASFVPIRRANAVGPAQALRCD
jgi:putative ABC transport system permease protein